MIKKTVRERLLASTMICGAAVAVLGASQAAAQTAAPAAKGSDQTQVEEIVVTGSLFRRTDTETPSPVTVLTSENLARAGISTASDAIRSISSDGAGSIGTGFQSGFSAGGSAVSLRGLGVSSTLVLVDGLRSTNFPINDDGHNAYVDLNTTAATPTTSAPTSPWATATTRRRAGTSTSTASTRRTAASRRMTAASR